MSNGKRRIVGPTRKVLIMGAAGRDFHNFNTCFRDDPSSEVVAFTATQIPGIGSRKYPPELAGPLYPDGIPIVAEVHLADIIKKESVDTVVFAYSDVTHEHVMHSASLALSLGADFSLLGPERTMIESKKPVLSVTAVRTGCGKSGVTRFVARLAADMGLKPVVVRHPMPYGNLLEERLQRFSSVKEMDAVGVTIEEREEYEPLVEAGFIVYAGIDYELILSEAEKEADIIIWDGGNNDMPFIRPDLSLVLLDPYRPGHEMLYHPGEANLRAADILVINKADSSRFEGIGLLLESIKVTNPGATVIETNSRITIEDVSGAGEIRHKPVVVIEDGPTLTHGGMTIGAGHRAAIDLGAVPVNPRQYAVGTIKETLDKYPSLMEVVPAMGYSKEQIKDLQKTVDIIPADAAIIATPIDLKHIIKINKPIYRVRYEVEDIFEEELKDAVEKFLKKACKGRKTQK